MLRVRVVCVCSVVNSGYNLGVSCIMVCTNTNIDSMFAVQGGLVLQGGSMKKIIMCTLDLNNKNRLGNFYQKRFPPADRHSPS